MEDFDQLENRRILIKNISIISAIVLVCIGLVAFIMFQQVPKNVSNPTSVNSSATTTPNVATKPLFSRDLATWNNYYWPGEINTHYPGDWKLKEDKNSNGIITGLEIIPPTNATEDTIFIGGTSVKCSNTSILQYSANKCLKSSSQQIPFYTNSKNPEVLSAFDFIFQNTILTVQK